MEVWEVLDVECFEGSISTSYLEFSWNEPARWEYIPLEISIFEVDAVERDKFGLSSLRKWNE